MTQSIRRIVLGFLIMAVVAPAAQAQTRGGYDGTGRLLMHGTPRFVLGVYDSGGGYSTDPAFWENQIFSPTGGRALQGFPLNVYLNYHLGEMPIGQTNALLDVLNNHGVMYLQTGNCFDTGSWTRYPFSIANQSYVQQFAQHPAALGYYIMDECVDSLVGETQQHHQQLHSWDPQGVTFAATLAAGYTNPALWTGAADVLGTDPYPLFGAEPAAGYTHFVVADHVSKLKAVARPDRPVWSVLQFFKFTSDSRMPTQDEMRAHAVMSIVEGAQGLFWWDIGVNGLRQLDGSTVSTYMNYLKTLTTEIAALEPALLADDANGALVGNSTRFADPVAGRIAQLQHNIAVEWLFSRKQWYQEELTALQAGDTSKSGGMLNGAANVRTKTKIVNGTGVVFAYNYTNLSQPVTFTWQNAPSSVREARSGQTYSLSGASWTDTFGPYQARIYIVEGAGSGGTTPPPPPPPGSSLSLAFTNPGSGATVSGTATVTLSASGGSGYSFAARVDGAAIYAGTNASFSWNTTSVGDGAHTLTATVTDSTGQTATASRTVTVSNGGGSPPPSTGASFATSFSYPGSGASVSGSQTVGMATTAAWGQSKTFTLSVDGTVLTSQSITGTTLWYTWDTTKVANGSRTLTAAVTMNGQTATATLPVTVSNGGSAAPPPPADLGASFTTPTSGATVVGPTTIGMASSGASGSSTFALAVDGTVVSTQTVSGASASYSWDSRTIANGSHTLTVTVTDGAGRTATATLPVTVSNAVAAPQASFTASFSYPGSGASVSGSQTVGMATTAPWGQSKTFTLSIDGVTITSQSITGTTLWYTWNTKKSANGSRTLTLAVTMNGQTATASLPVTLSNASKPSVALDVNSSTFTRGDALQVKHAIANPGDALTADVYFGALLPADVASSYGCPAGAGAIAFAKDNFASFEVRCTTDSPASYPRLAAGASIPADMPLTTNPDYFGFTWAEAPPGPYVIFLALTKPGALSGGTIGEGDILVLTTTNLTYTN